MLRPVLPISSPQQQRGDVRDQPSHEVQFQQAPHWPQFWIRKNLAPPPPMAFAAALARVASKTDAPKLADAFKAADENGKLIIVKALRPVTPPASLNSKPLRNRLQSH